jgi:hypothetical protein
MAFRTFAFGIMATALVGAHAASAGEISALNQHFDEPGKSISPWMFVPKENIKDFSTEEHPGLAMIREAGHGHDVKGLLEKPIGIGEYRLPWEFQTAFVQSFNLTAGVGVKTERVASAPLAECSQGLTELGAPTELSLLLLREFHGASFYVNN